MRRSEFYPAAENYTKIPGRGRQTKVGGSLDAKTIARSSRMLLTSGATVTNAGATKTLEGWRVALGEQVTA